MKNDNKMWAKKFNLKMEASRLGFIGQVS